MKYAFVLGREPALSTAELVAALSAADVGFEPRRATYSPAVMIAETSKPLDAEFFHALGGSVKMAEVLGASLKALEEDLFDVLNGIEGPSLDFGLSIYQLGRAGERTFRSLERGVKPVSLTLKKRLRDEGGRSVRAVIGDEPRLTSVQVDKNGLIRKGAELLILVGQEILIARTIAVQAFEEFSERDFGRPAADAKSGMLPPKLARLMVNLALAPKDQLLLDPFCGSGTVLTEAASLGYRKLAGTDISEKAADDTRANVEWTVKRSGLQKVAFETAALDVKNLSERFKPASVAAIVSEPFLGPPLRGDESDQKIHFIYLELMGLYRRAFEAFAKVLKPGAPVVFVFPVFGNKHVNLLRELQELGFKAEALLPAAAVEALGAKSATGLLYRRAGQKVGRDVFRFRFSKA